MDRLELEELIKEIKATKPLVDENLESGHYSTLNARRGRQTRAIETMKELTAKYTQKLTQSAVFVLVAGASKNEFTALASEKTGVFSADPEDFYKGLLKEIHPSLYNSGPNNIFDVLGRVLENKMLDLNVREYPQPQFKNTYQRTIKGADDVLQLIKDVINDQVGGEIAGVNAISSIVPKAIEKGYGGRNTTVVLNTQDEKLTLRLMTALTEISPYVFLVVAGKAKVKDFKIKGAITVAEVNEKNVTSVMETISGQVNEYEKAINL